MKTKTMHRTIRRSAGEKIFDVLDKKNYRVMSYPLLMVNTKTLSGDVYTEFAFNEITIKHVEPTPRNVDNYFKNSEIHCALILPENMSSKSNETTEIQIITDASDPNFSKIAINYLSATITDFLNKPNVVQKMPMQIKTEWKTESMRSGAGKAP